MDDALKFKVSETLLDLYCLYRQKWVRMMDPDVVVYPVQTMKTRYTDGDILNHLDGNYSVCVFSGAKATKFLSFDIDVSDPQVVRKVIDTAEEIGIPRDMVYVSASGRKGYHADIFFDDYIYNNQSAMLYCALIERSGLDPRKVEYRPTNRQAIKLPLGVHQVTHNRCWFVDRETLEPIEDFKYIFDIRKIQRDEVEKILRQIVSEHTRRITNERRNSGNDAPVVHVPVSESLTITAKGTRHGLQKKVAARARMDGSDYDGIVRKQMEWYDKQDKSLIGSTEKEVRKDAETLAAWAVKNVEVNRRGRNLEGMKLNGTIRIAKSAIPYILKAPTKATRLVLFLLVVFSEIYDEPRMSFETIAKYTGLTERTVSKSIGWLDDNKFIRRTRTQSDNPDVFVMRYGANRYTFPGEKRFYVPDRKNLNADYYDIREFVTEKNLHETYYRALATICKQEYLAKYLTKPEMKECTKYAWMGGYVNDSTRI